jgi:hypothetical protein
MDTITGPAISGVISLVVAIVITAGIAQVLAPPWSLTGILIAVAVASFCSGACSHHFGASDSSS